ncbi:hypothetical protein BGZ58_006189 [Dissophora ornata]|nr:hypothetical protein BGZ58_006189 [Dissophora ornata]
MSLESAVDALTKNLESGEYFRQVSPKEFDAEGLFERFDNQRRAHVIWSNTVFPRLVSSKNRGLQSAGLALQKKWNSEAYKKRA